MSPDRSEQGRSSANPKQHLLHGWDYEDERIELGLLEPGSRVLAVAGAGELVARIAAEGHHVTAVGANRMQLEYAERRANGGGFEPGAAERFLETGRRLIRAASPSWRRRALEALLAETSPERAQQQWRQRFDNRTFRSILRTTLAPAGLLASLVQHDFTSAVPAHFADTIRARLDERIGVHPLAGNRFAWRLLLGEDPKGERLPAVPEGSIRFVAESVRSHLEAAAPGTYEAVTLSNIGDGAGADEIARISRAARAAVVEGGPVIVRSFETSMDARAVALAGEDRSLLWGSIAVHR